jgi:CDP-4-dehydro-6-deoxyglucose reductase
MPSLRSYSRASHMRKKATVTSVRQLSPAVRSLNLDIEGGLAFQPGQWLNVFLPGDGTELRRAYSIASAPSDTRVELAVTHVSGGAMSPRLHALAPGDALQVDGPHGFFTRTGEAADAPTLFVATGTGIAPMRSMLRALASASHAQPPLVLLFGCRTAADALYLDELRSLFPQPGTLRVELTLSRPPSGYTGRTGYVQAHVAELSAELPEGHVFVCGLGPMVNAVRALCKTELGYDRRRIHSERFDP